MGFSCAGQHFRQVVVAKQSKSHQGGHLGALPELGFLGLRPDWCKCLVVRDFCHDLP